jgi:hypothetical protein
MSPAPAAKNRITFAMSFAAFALNGIEFNFARAVGPALAGIVIAAAGVATTFVLNVVSFAGVLGVIAHWKRPVRNNAAPRETLTGALAARFRYIRFSPEIKAVMARQGTSMFFASALSALLPWVAHSTKCVKSARERTPQASETDARAKGSRTRRDQRLRRGKGVRKHPRAGLGFIRLLAPL